MSRIQYLYILCLIYSSHAEHEKRNAHIPIRHSYAEVHNRFAIAVPQPIPISVPRAVPVSVPVGVPVDNPRPVPVAIPHPVPHIIPRPYAIPVDRPFPLPVAQPVPVTITQGVGIPVPQPYVVSVPSAVPVRVPQPVPVPVIAQQAPISLIAQTGSVVSPVVSQAVPVGIGSRFTVSSPVGSSGWQPIISSGSTYASSYGRW